ncbi:MAG: Arf family protein [Asgard group archaeon]|nr:Arf family protein [Asgard group archaeon]
MSFFLKLFGEEKKQINITICGLDNAGKTTIVKYLIKGNFVETHPTMGVNHEIIELPKVTLNIFDLGGQKDFRILWKEINEKSDALIFVIDSSDHIRLEEARDIFYKIINEQIKKQITILILLNKIDKSGTITQEEFIEKFDLPNLRSSIIWAVFQVSAKTGTGIIESFNWLVNKIQEA